VQVCSIYSSVIWPLQLAGVKHVHLYVHTYHMDHHAADKTTQQSSGRYVDRAAGGDEEVWRLLPHVRQVVVQDQSAALASIGNVSERFSGGHADPWKNNWYSLRNYVLALHSMNGACAGGPLLARLGTIPGLICCREVPTRNQRLDQLFESSHLRKDGDTPNSRHLHPSNRPLSYTARNNECFGVTCVCAGRGRGIMGGLEKTTEGKRMLEAADPTATVYSAVMSMRADVAYWNPMSPVDVRRVLAAHSARSQLVLTPAFHRWAHCPGGRSAARPCRQPIGTNDRFALGTPAAMRRVLGRFELAEAYSVGQPVHAESFLTDVLKRYKVCSFVCVCGSALLDVYESRQRRAHTCARSFGFPACKRPDRQTRAK